MAAHFSTLARHVQQVVSKIPAPEWDTVDAANVERQEETWLNCLYAWTASCVHILSVCIHTGMHVPRNSASLLGAGAGF